MRTALVLLLLAGVNVALAADAEAWKSQVLYFIITDRFAQSPGATPGGPCVLTGWNNGTWSGITNKLDYLKDMGMTAIWITPIPLQLEGEHFGEVGYHGYWARDWTQLEPHYGTEEDLQELIKTAREKGMMTMLDVVGNHVGPVGTNFSDVVPFNKPEYYHACIKGCDAEGCSIPQHAYESKPQNATLITQCRLQGLPDLNQSVPFVKEQLLQWVNNTVTKYDFDGLRIDTVKHVDPSFWKDYSAAAGRFTLGEVLNGDTTTLVPYIQGPTPAMSSVLNFPLYYALNNAFVQQHGMQNIATERAKQYDVLGSEVVSTMGNFVDNHDVPRFLTQQSDKTLLANALAWVMLADGIPTIYYGTGAGMTGDVPKGGNRACLWEYGYNKTGIVFQTIKTLAKFRNANELWKQPEQTLSATDECYIYARGPNALVITTNVGSGQSIVCSAELPENVTLLDNGLAGVEDVLVFTDKAPTQPTPKASKLTGNAPNSGLTWNPDNRKLTVRLVNGAPRVLSTEEAVAAVPVSAAAAAAAVNGSDAAAAAAGAPQNAAGVVSVPAFIAVLAVFVVALLL